MTLFSYIKDRKSAGFEAAVTFTPRLGWTKYMECQELLRKGYPPNLKATVYRR